MATLQDVVLHIPGEGHVLFADVDAPAFDFDKFVFGDVSTYGTWTWWGDTQLDTPVEFSVDGGDVAYKHTWDRKNVRTTRASKTLSGVIHTVNVGRDTFEKAFPGGVWDATTKSYTGSLNTTQTTKKAIIIISVDSEGRAGWRFPNTEITGNFPEYNTEEFLSIPLTMSILGSKTTPGAEWQWFSPRPFSGAVTTTTTV